MEIVCGGIKITIITQANQNFLKGKSNLANPYPAKVHIEIWITAMDKEISKEFQNAVLYSIRSNANL